MSEIPDECSTLFVGFTPEDGIIRLSKWPEGFLLWYHGEIVWKSWESTRALMAERDRCLSIKPEPDIEKPVTPYEDGYCEGFSDCAARFISAIKAGEQP